MVLGDPKSYYRAYSKEEFKTLKGKDLLNNPKSMDEWLTPAAKYINIDSLKFPIFMVNEFGLNMFRVAAGAEIFLREKKHVSLKLNSEVIDVKQMGDKF